MIGRACLLAIALSARSPTAYALACECEIASSAGPIAFHRAAHFSRAVAGMAKASAAAQAASARVGGDPQGWGDAPHQEALVLQETVTLAQQRRARPGLSVASILDPLAKLHHHRPDGDRAFAGSLTR